LVLHVVHVTEGGFEGTIWLTLGEDPGGLTVKTYPSPETIGTTHGRFELVSTSSVCSVVGEISVTELVSGSVTQTFVPSKATPLGRLKP
jgi:hypothetical protein